ncbi:signal peptidase I [Treponema sp. C6A8]|uniref:signal peptidase I n=1 Tax=Treponema sp. C6A8 TaxID=1410609 RepID=UPI000684C386|nr:signal peptidase I [Treponema sp. C6A8]
MNKEFESFKKLSCIQLACAALFTLLLINFSFDISLLAFPMALAFTGILAFLLYNKIFIETDGGKAVAVLKLIQYLPYFLLICFILRRAGKNGTPYVLDLVTVLLWAAIFVTSLMLSNKMNEKHIKKLTENWKIKPDFKKPKGAGRIAYEVIDWVDALIWAIFTVMLFQIFVFQLYEIPSESMVPTFLIKDRVIVSKIDCGPKFPLTNIGLPDFRKYKRGQTIVLRNPHYSLDRKSEVKTVTSQLIYMLTFMTVNLNRDEDGELKADPLVKRICGVPGEQLVMQDGKLYARTKNHDFEEVTLDNKFATWNLNDLQPGIKKKVQTFPLSASEYEEMLNFEEYRRNYDLTVAEFRANEIVRNLQRLTGSEAAAKIKSSEEFKAPSLFEYKLFSNASEIAYNIITKKDGLKWFSDFMTSWTGAKNKERDLYAEANYRLNVMAKIVFGNIVLRTAELQFSNAGKELWEKDSLLSENYELAQKLNWYIQSLLDERNMPLFPANDENGNAQYIPANCYFMMGDNRFNSLDLRHSYEQTEKPLTPDDKNAITYYSMMAPQYVNKRYIIGKPVYRFWPATRRGKV